LNFVAPRRLGAELPCARECPISGAEAHLLRLIARLEIAGLQDRGVIKNEDAGPVLDPGARVGAAGIRVQQAAVADTPGRTDQEVGAETEPVLTKDVKGCHAKYSSGEVFRIRNTIANIAISHQNAEIIVTG
jgi:hypothetical protein